MRLADLMNRAGEWLRGLGPANEVVISSRVRLARNLAGMPFLSRCTEQQRGEIEERLRDHILQTDLAPEMFYVDIAAAGELDRQLLVERHLISRHHAQAEGHRGVAVSGDETIAIMVNEEDHLRMQVLRSGLQLADAVRDINRIDDLLEQRLDFAYHSRYGYLTACPTNVGTGLRVSVMLHLPALKMTGEIDKLFRAAQDLHLAVRGLYGEGTEFTGDFFQLSNQTTLGRSEEQIIDDFQGQLLPEFIQYEQRARRSLAANQKLLLEDKVCRALAILRSARLLGSEETMSLLSMVRLGVAVGLVGDVDVPAINELFLQTQPAHLQRIHNRQMSPLDRGAARAQYIRRRLGEKN